MVTRRAQCACGQLSATCSGEPIRVSVCHCLNCKRRTGSAFSHNARFARETVVVEGRAGQFVNIGDEGGRATYHFCPDCGANVYYLIEAQPDQIVILVGAFADMSFPPPSFAVYDERRYPWIEITADPLTVID